MPEVGEKFGRYVLMDIVGKGGMARVYRALRSGPMGFRKQVAIKQILPDVAADEKVVKALINEARMGGLLHHRNLVEIYEFDQEDDVFYIAMEFVQGHMLSEILLQGREIKQPVPPRIVVDIGCQLCEGLAYAHAAGDEDGRPMKLVHRDIKPSNLMLSDRGLLKIMDFGIAKAATNLFHTTLAGITKGTPVYMSPEQVRGEALDQRSDLFAAGSIIAELATGRIVFDDKTLPAVLTKVVNADISGIMPQVQQSVPALAPVLQRALQPAADDRFASAAEMGQALRDVIPQLPPAPPIEQWLEGWFTAQPPPKEEAPLSEAIVVSTGDAASPSTGETMELDIEKAFEEGNAELSLEVPPGQAAAHRIGLTQELELMDLAVDDGEDGEGRTLVAHGHGVLMVELEPGTFWMGSPEGEKGRHDDETRHKVQLAHPFLVAITPVTQAQWKAAMGENPSHVTADDLPVENISWMDALEFCNRLSALEGLQPAYRKEGGRLIWDRKAAGFRMLTEAEWEYAARAGSTTRFAGSNDADEVAWHWDNAEGQPQPVRSKKPNAWGLYDMSGNVWEWVWDVYSPYATDGTVRNPAGLHSGTGRICRGGSWYSMLFDLRVSCRHRRARPSDRTHYLGLRIGRTIG